MILSRRNFTTALSALLAGCAFDPDDAGGSSASQSSALAGAGGAASEGPQQIGMLLYPDFTTQDLIGPQLILSALGNVQVHLLWKEATVVTSDSGVGIQATTALRDCPRHLDILFVPGGVGTWRAMEDGEILAFV